MDGPLRQAHQRNDRLTHEQAMVPAGVGAQEYEANERAAHNALEWENPEDEADEEMSYWDDDEGGART